MKILPQQSPEIFLFAKHIPISSPVNDIFFPLPSYRKESPFPKATAKFAQGTRDMLETAYNICSLVVGILLSCTIVWVLYHLYFYKRNEGELGKDDGGDKASNKIKAAPNLLEVDLLSEVEIKHSYN